MKLAEATPNIDGESSPRRLKVAVYAIAKNEEQHVQRFMSSVEAADVVTVADTGSTDATVAVLKSAGASVHEIHISPWRFDDARNAALALVPADVDVCISLDLDEILVSGWREALERAWQNGTTRMRYRFVASWTADGQPGTVFWNERVHARQGYRWQMPVHEAILWCGEGTESVISADEFEAHHHPDKQKSRANYLPLLQRAVAEAPNDPRPAHYLGREYFYWKQYREAIKELQRHLNLVGATWAPQRAEACRLLGKCFDALDLPDDALRWFWKATLERPEQREPWVDLSRALYRQRDFSGGYFAAHRALTITERATDYFSEPEAWGALPDDLLSVCAWEMGMAEQAATHAEAAARLAPDDERIQANWQFFQNRQTSEPSAQANDAQVLT